MKVALFASKNIGRHVLDYLIKKYPEDLLIFVYLDSDVEITNEFVFPEFTKVYSYSEILKKDSEFLRTDLDLIILAWWPELVPDYIYAKSRLGAINTHNSLLPYCRGVHPNYWSIRNDEPYGVTIHRVTNNIDAGNIVKQVKIEKLWTDDGQSLYDKGINRLKKLFEEVYPNISELIIKSIPQKLIDGTIYSLKDINGSYRLDLDKQTKVRDVLNIIRAKQFNNSPSAEFIENGVTYEVKIEIKKKN